MKFRTAFNPDSLMIIIEASKSDFMENDVCRIAMPFSLNGDLAASYLQGAFSVIFELLRKA